MMNVIQLWLEGRLALACLLCWSLQPDDLTEAGCGEPGAGVNFAQQQKLARCRMNQHYQIQVRGHLTDGWMDWFAGLRIYRLDSADTLLVGELDQAGLHGVLARIRDLNLTLIAVNQAGEETVTGKGCS